MSSRRFRVAPSVHQAVALIFILLLAAPAGAQTVISTGTNFTGSNRTQSGFIPPDTMGAVGPNHVVELINGRYAVYNRTGTLQTASSLDNFWINAGVVPAGSFSFDPRIVYDQHSSRWFATAVDNAGGANNFLLGVSNSSDPTAGWSGRAIDSDADDTNWADFPMLGLNQDVVTVSANMFPIGAGSFTTGFVVADKAQFIANPATATVTSFEAVASSSTGGTPQPVLDLDNNNLPLGILSSFNKPAGSLKTSSIGGTSTVPTLNTAGGFIAVTSRGAPVDIPQPNAGEVDIDAGDNRFSGNVVQQHIPGRLNPSLWAVHGVVVSGRAAIEWYEIDTGTNIILQSGLISDPSLSFNYPSISVNDFGDVVIGFSGGDASTFMSTYYVAGTTLGGVTALGSPVLTQAGLADYEALDSGGRNRWGDYSATVLDPAIPRSFWTFQEYVSATDVWSVKITQINFAVIPEISTIGLLGVLLAGVAVCRHRRA